MQYNKMETNRELICEGYSRKKYLGGEKKANDIFFYGWLVLAFFKLYGSLVFEKI